MEAASEMASRCFNVALVLLNVLIAMRRSPCGSADASAGIGVFFGPGDRRNLVRRLPASAQKPATNQRAEMMALIAALQVLQSELSL